MTTELEPNIDAYGSRARTCALADFVELWALGNQHPSMADLGDYIGDAAWGRKMQELYTPPPAAPTQPEYDEDISENASAAARRVFDVLEERGRLLGDRYPFNLVNGRLYFIGARESPYLVPFAITIAHAYRIAVAHPVEDVFEETVTRVLARCARRAVNFSRVRSAHPDFDLALLDAGDQIGLRVTPRAMNRAIHANDEKVDVIVHLDWRDDRVGAWTMIGQVTCAVSDEWGGKLQEVPVPGWQRYLGQTILPQPFLAIPHHIDADHLYNLVAGHARLVVDRIRVVLWLNEQVPEEQRIVDAVLSAPVTNI